jgi:hypothetical protein
LGALGFTWDQARAYLDAVILLPHDPEVLAWAEQARAIFTSLGAKPYLAILDRELAAAPMDKTATTATA